MRNMKKGDRVRLSASGLAAGFNSDCDTATVLRYNARNEQVTLCIDGRKTPERYSTDFWEVIDGVPVLPANLKCPQCGGIRSNGAQKCMDCHQWSLSNRVERVGAVS